MFSSSSYKNLSPRTRLLFGIGLMAWAGIGMTASPQIESALGLVPTEQQKGELEKKMNVKIVSVEREKWECPKIEGNRTIWWLQDGGSRELGRSKLFTQSIRVVDQRNDGKHKLGRLSSSDSHWTTTKRQPRTDWTKRFSGPFSPPTLEGDDNQQLYGATESRRCITKQTWRILAGRW